jgi:Predicted xylanase/chitin deacetylase
MGYQGIRPLDWLLYCRQDHPLPAKPVLFTFDDGYADLTEHAFPVLRRYGFGAAVYIVTSQFGGTNAWDVACGSMPHRLMTAEQISYWSTQGIEFGAHSRTHPDLTKEPPAQLEDEILGSADDLKKVVGARVVSFAYPYGWNSPAVVACVRRYFDVAFAIDSSDRGINDTSTDPYLLRRTMVQSTDLAIDVLLRARFGYSPLENMRRKVRLRSRLMLRK